MFVASNTKAVGNYLEHAFASTTILGNIYSANWPIYAPKGVGFAAEIDMPAVDFNSANPDSYEQKALAEDTTPGKDCYFNNATQFEAYLAAQGPTVTLSCETTYVAGNQAIALDGPLTLKTVASGGVLTSINDFEIGKNSGPVNLDIYHGTGPSGILSGKKIRFLEHTGEVAVRGVIYANAELDILNLDPVTSNFYVLGGAVSQKLDIDSCYGWPTIEYDNEILIDTLGYATSAPTLIIEHWEEEY
jgi:hypothetical protein